MPTPPNHMPSLAKILPPAELKKLLTAKELAQVRDADAAWRAGSEKLNHVSHENTRIRIRAARDRLAQTGTVDEGRFEIVKDAEMARSRQIRHGLKVHLAKISRETIGPAILGPVTKAAKFLEARLVEIERAESAVADSLAIPFCPSESVLGLRGLIHIVRHQVAGAESGQWSGPVPRFFFGTDL